MIGYATLIKEGIRVWVDRTTWVNFELEQTVVGQEVVVTAKRPLVEQDVTASVKYVKREDVENIPNVLNFQDVVELQPGAVGRGRAIHIRGGRIGEVTYVIDGIEVQEPIRGAAALNLDIEAIEEIQILTGGFNAEYGRAQSAVINIVTKEGGNQYSGEFHIKRDHLGFKGYNTDYAYFSLGGPEPISTFLLNSLGMKASKPLRFFFSDSTNYNNRRTKQFTFTLTHTLSKETFYTLNLGYIDSKYIANVNGMTPPDYWHWEVEYDSATGTYDSTYVGKAWGWDTDSDGFADKGSVQQYWREEHSQVWTVKLDLTSQVHPHHLMKAGFEVQPQHVVYVDIQYGGAFYYPGRDTIPGPWPEYGIYRWVFDGYPCEGSVYIQDKIEFAGLVVNAGLRLDYFWPGENVRRSHYTEQWERITGQPITVRKLRTYLSPRLGLAFPVTDRAKMYFSYGHFAQMPDLSVCLRYGPGFQTLYQRYLGISRSPEDGDPAGICLDEPGIWQCQGLRDRAAQKIQLLLIRFYQLHLPLGAGVCLQLLCRVLSGSG